MKKILSIALCAAAVSAFGATETQLGGEIGYDLLFGFKNLCAGHDIHLLMVSPNANTEIFRQKSSLISLRKTLFHALKKNTI